MKHFLEKRKRDATGGGEQKKINKLYVSQVFFKLCFSQFKKLFDDPSTHQRKLFIVCAVRAVRSLPCRCSYREFFFSRLVPFEKNKNKNVVEFVWEQHAQCAGVHNLGLLLSGI